MKFYTNVEQAGNNLLVRGYEGGQAFSYKVKFNPTLYLPSSNFSKWRTLEGECVQPMKQGTISDAKETVARIPSPHLVNFLLAVMQTHY